MLKEIAVKRLEQEHESKIIVSTNRDTSETLTSSDMNFSDSNMEN